MAKSGFVILGFWKSCLKKYEEEMKEHTHEQKEKALKLLSFILVLYLQYFTQVKEVQGFVLLFALLHKPGDLSIYLLHFRFIYLSTYAT